MSDEGTPTLKAGKEVLMSYYKESPIKPSSQGVIGSVSDHYLNLTFEKILSQDDGDGMLYLVMGLRKVKDRDYEGAFESYGKAEENFKAKSSNKLSDLAVAYYELGLKLKDLGDGYKELMKKVLESAKRLHQDLLNNTRSERILILQELLSRGDITITEPKPTLKSTSRFAIVPIGTSAQDVDVATGSLVQSLGVVASTAAVSVVSAPLSPSIFPQVHFLQEP